MRKGRRKVLMSLSLFLLGTSLVAASPEPGPPAQPDLAGGAVRLTIEVSWRGTPGEGGTTVWAPLLVLSEGQILETRAWPPRSPQTPSLGAEGWRLGSGATGRVRARLEAPIESNLLFHVAGKVSGIPLGALLDGPQKLIPLPGLELRVERLAWDAISIDQEQGTGTAEPGAVVPISVGFNILTLEPTDVALHALVQLLPVSGGEPLWRQELNEVVTTNLPDQAHKRLSVPAPATEGTYYLEVRSSWEPLSNLEGSRIGRLIRRRRSTTNVNTAVRRVALTVLGNKPVKWDAATKTKGKGAGTERQVELIDLARLRGERPSATGRAPTLLQGGATWQIPEAALVEATRRDRVRGWITRAGSETAILAPASPAGLAWSALGLSVKSPGRPHRLTVTVTGGHPSALGVALVDTGGANGTRPRVLLDACASGPPILEGTPVSTFSWLVWPDDTNPVLVLVNRDQMTHVQLGSVTLTELSGIPAPPVIQEPEESDRRGLGLYLPCPELLDRFGGGFGGVSDSLAMALNLSQYLVYCGVSSIVVPESLSDRAQRRGLDGQAGEDSIGADRMDLLLRVLHRQGLKVWLEMDMDAPLAGLPAPGTPEALARGLVRVDRQGKVDGPVYHPLNPEVREALKRRFSNVASLRGTRPALAGLLVRLGPGLTLLGAPDTGVDDLTFGRFVRESFGPETAREIPGLGTVDPGRFDARSRFLAGPGRMPWLSWRARGVATLYAQLAQAVHEAGSGAALAVATPGLDDGPAGDAARRFDLAGLAPIHAWRSIGLDLETWPTGPHAPIVLRGTGISADELSHDLATSPELDAPVAARPGRGLLVGLEEPTPQALKWGGERGLRLNALPLPEGATGDELMGHALAAIDAQYVLLTASAVAGHEERLRQFAQVFRALPASPAAVAPLDRQPFGVAVRPLRHGPMTYLSLANDTPYPVRVETRLGGGTESVEDLGRSLRLNPESVGEGRRLVLDLLPYGVAAVRVGSAQVKVGPVTPYPSDAVLAEMRERYEELSSQLSRLSKVPQGGVVLGPPNSEFEPNPSSLVRLTGVRGGPPPSGWTLVDETVGSTEIDQDRPHGGRGSLRLDGDESPVSILSEEFPAAGYSVLTVRGWFRSDHPNAKLRLWIEGKGAGQPYRRWSDLSIADDWTSLGVRGAELPPEGLSKARIRFELLTQGSVWVDDLQVFGEVPTEPERENTRRVLVAAIHAYRNKQYADFARLAASHWARTSSAVTVTTAEPARPDHPETIRTGKANTPPPASILR